MKRNNAIEAHDVYLSFGSSPARVQILKGVSLEVTVGETLAIVGKSGSGKSSLLMCLAGLERPESGQILVEGRDITAMGRDDCARLRGKRIGIVFQSFHLISTMTAIENVAVPLELTGHQHAFEVALRELKAVGLEHRINHFPRQLSGGEQQRVAIARATAPKPAIILADEPTGNLDEETGKQIAEILFRLPMERSTSLVLATHDLALAKRCNRTFFMKSGVGSSE
jgi:putative ABC transport system ATP-binding protein